MKAFFTTGFLAAAFFLAGTDPSFAAKIETMPANSSGNGPTEHCAVTVEFGSYGDGIDKAVFNKVESFVSGASTITSAHLYAWGSTGEQTFCLSADSDDEAGVVYTNIKNLIPPQPAHGNITVTKGAESFSVP